MKRALTRTLLLALSVLSVPRVLATDAPLPYTFVVEVVQGHHRVPEAFVRDLKDRIEADLRARSCVRSLALHGAGEAAVVLQLILDDALEETRYDFGASDRNRFPDSEVQGGYVATFEVRAQAEILALPSRSSVRSKLFRAKASCRPVTPGEDAAAEARKEGATRVAREACSLVCGGSRKKLARDLEAALDSHGDR